MLGGCWCVLLAEVQLENRRPIGAAVYLVGAGGISVTQGRMCLLAPPCRGQSVTATRFCSAGRHVLTRRAPSWHGLPAGPRSLVWLGPPAGLSAQLRLQDGMERVRGSEGAAKGMAGWAQGMSFGCPTPATRPAACSIGFCITAREERGRCSVSLASGTATPALPLPVVVRAPWCLLIPVC